MAKTHVPYSPEFRRQMVELVRAGRDPTDLAREFEPSSQAIRNWVARADRQEVRREETSPGLSVGEREELSRLRRENKQLRQERWGASMLLEAGKLWTGQSWREVPLPYGTRPRLVMVHVSSEAIRIAAWMARPCRRGAEGVM